MSNYTIAAVDEALALMLLVAQNPGLGVTELARLSNNTKARTFRLLHTLEQRNFIVRRQPGPLHYLDVQSLYLGVAAQDQIALVRVGRVWLLELGRRTDENVQMRVRDGMECVCIDHWASPHSNPQRGGAGRRRKLHAGASSKLLLAHAPPDVRHAFLGGELPRYTPHTLTQRGKLAQELARIETDGYAVSEGEITESIMAIAAPIRDGQGRVVAALSVSGEHERLANRKSELIGMVLEHANAISRQLAASMA